MSEPKPDHERLFDEICNKLSELGQSRPEENAVPNDQTMDRLQTQIRRFHSDLQDTQQEMRDKIKALEDVQVSHQSDLHHQLRQMTEQLNNERAANTKLNADLAKSLELGLTLQLEIQNLKSRAQQMQVDERKYSQSLQDKVRQVSHDLELSRALREELETELTKARSRYLSELEGWNKDKAAGDEKLRVQIKEKSELLNANEELLTNFSNKEKDVERLHGDLVKISKSFTEMEESSRKQSEIMKSLTEVAENKIVELKMALDRKTAESRDYEGHLQQALTQNQLLRHENTNLKDYIGKVNVYLQQVQPGPMATAQPAGAYAGAQAQSPAAPTSSSTSPSSPSGLVVPAPHATV